MIAEYSTAVDARAANKVIQDLSIFALTDMNLL